MSGVLIVDDDPEIVSVIQTMLYGRGWDIATAGTAVEAMAAMATHDPEVVLLDMRMPVGSPDWQGVVGQAAFIEDMRVEDPGAMNGGLWFLERYQQVRPSTRVIVLTGYPELGDAVSALEGGADAKAVAYLNKPVAPKTLYEEVEKNMRSLAVGDWEADTVRKELTYKGALVEGVTPTMFELAVMFMQHPKRPFQYEQMVLQVRGERVSRARGTTTYKTTLHRLRTVMQDVAAYEAIIYSQGRGYLFDPYPPDHAS